MTITVGWWVLPLAVTLGAFIAWWRWEAGQPAPSGYGAIGAGLASLIMGAGVVIVSLVAWLVWALLR
jgi:hypothetical protein